MLRTRFAAAIALAILPTAEAAHACRIAVPLELEDVKYADVVVTGRIANYEVVRDEEFRRKMLASPHLTPDMRKSYEGEGGLLPDYARFEVEVDQVLVGQASDRITVTWDNSTFAEPAEMAAGPFLIALREPSSAMPSLRGPSATILPSREPHSLTVLQAPCSRPFIFDTMSSETQAIRLILSNRPQ